MQTRGHGTLGGASACPRPPPPPPLGFHYSLLAESFCSSISQTFPQSSARSTMLLRTTPNSTKRRSDCCPDSTEGPPSATKRHRRCDSSSDGATSTATEDNALWFSTAFSPSDPTLQATPTGANPSDFGRSNSELKRDSSEVNVFTDPFNWVDEDAVFSWRIHILDICKSRKDELVVYNNNTVEEVKETLAQLSAYPKKVKLFRVIDDVGIKELKDSSLLRECTSNNGVLIAYPGNLPALFKLVTALKARNEATEKLTDCASTKVEETTVLSSSSPSNSP